MSEENRIQIELFPNGCMHLIYNNRYGPDKEELGLDLGKDKAKLHAILDNILLTFELYVTNVSPVQKLKAAFKEYRTNAYGEVFLTERDKQFMYTLEKIFGTDDAEEQQLKKDAGHKYNKEDLENASSCDCHAQVGGSGRKCDLCEEQTKQEREALNEKISDIILVARTKNKGEEWICESIMEVLSK